MIKPWRAAVAFLVTPVAAGVLSTAFLLIVSQIRGNRLETRALPLLFVVMVVQAFAMLVVGGLTKTKAGFLWRKLSVKGQVTNKGTEPLSGQLTLTFKKGGDAVQTETLPIALLAPGQSLPFTKDSAVAADEVEVKAKAL